METVAIIITIIIWEKEVMAEEATTISKEGVKAEATSRKPFRAFTRSMDRVKANMVVIKVVQMAYSLLISSLRKIMDIHARLIRKCQSSF